MRKSALQRFAGAAALGLLALGISVAILTRQLATDEMQILGIQQNENMARALAVASHHHIAPLLVAADAGVPASALREDDSVYTLRSALVEPLQGLRVVRIKVYSAGGRTAFSTEPIHIGTRAQDNEGFLQAMDGQTVNEMVHHGSYNASDGVVEDRDLLETYVPMRDPHSGRVLGVFELYTDMTPLLAQIGAAQSKLLRAPLAIMALLLAALFAIFRRTAAGLRTEEQRAEQYLGELHEARDTLEQQVQERTRDLVHSEQRFKDVADAAGEYIWELDAQGRFTFVSDRVRDVLGYTPRELIGRTPLEFVPAQDAEFVRGALGNRSGEGAITGLEHRSYTRSGELIWLHANAVPVVDANGVTTGLRGACSDITSRKRAVDALSKMSLATEQSSEAVIITDTGGAIEYVNPAFTQISGYTQSDVAGRTPQILRAPGQTDGVYAQLWRTILAGEIWRGELRNKRKDGSLFWNWVSIFPLRDHAQNITHYVGLQSDITPRKEAERAVLEGAAKLKAVMDSVTDAIITCDVNGIIELLNPAACKLFGYTEAELVGQELRTLMPQPYHREHASYMKHYLDTGEGRIIGVGGREVEGLHKDGSVMPLELGVGTMMVAGKTGFVGVLRDLTERRRHERELEAVRQSYFHREKMAGIGQLAAGIVHEVGNPVAAIVGAVGALRGRADALDPASVAARKADLDLVAAQADRLTLMTREISDFVRPRPVETALLDLNQVARSALSLVRYDARVQKLQLKLDLDSSIPAVMGSADQLTQVILNLVINAADAGQGALSQTGFIEIRTCGGVDGVELIVRDNGIGMDQITLERARTAYFSTKQAGTGMGLGLSLCEDIVTQHAGQMSIESSPGEGTTVTISLPVDPAHWNEI